ncbi:plastocyanin [Aquabacterium sp.]|uniref:plastocyanin n=1 Tax=Aquabacterium sp. TaxID=1872578 RepID=UPI003783FAC4
MPKTSLACVAVAALTGLLSCGLASAAQLQVTVTTPDGKPAADVAVLVQPTAAWPQQPLPEPAVIAQQNIRFVPFVTVVPVGGTVRFVNRDRYDHHVRSQPGGPLGNVAPAKEFEFRMAAMKNGKEGPPADLKLEVPGSIVLGCHLHGSMRGHVLVSPTPWYAVTDDKGVARITNVPDGQVELKLWHPDQLTDQATQRVQAAGAMSIEAPLNFAPRRRSAAPASGYDKY